MTIHQINGKIAALETIFGIVGQNEFERHYSVQYKALIAEKDSIEGKVVNIYNTKQSLYVAA